MAARTWFDETTPLPAADRQILDRAGRLLNEITGKALRKASASFALHKIYNDRWPYRYAQDYQLPARA